MKKVAKLGIVALLLVSIIGSAFAFSGRGFGNEAAREAPEAGDFAKWKEAKNTELTEGRFNQLRERHGQMAEKRAEIEETMEKGYEAWKEAVADSPRGEELTDSINEENFDSFVEMHNLREDGDFEAAQEIAEELGIGYGKRGHERCGFSNRIPSE
ncbi:MAG: hypothetical protein KAK00_01660 [Nanoarchaeota archaeon]|nr:hypothetical protein [Nanoarchaeota archaeon]